MDYRYALIYFYDSFGTSGREVAEVEAPKPRFLACQWVSYEQARKGGEKYSKPRRNSANTNQGSKVYYFREP